MARLDTGRTSEADWLERPLFFRKRYDGSEWKVMTWGREIGRVFRISTGWRAAVEGASTLDQTVYRYRKEAEKAVREAYRAQGVNR